MLTMEMMLDGHLDPEEFEIDHLGLDYIGSDAKLIFDIGTGDQMFANEAAKRFPVIKTDSRIKWVTGDVILVKADIEPGTCYVMQQHIEQIDPFRRKLDLIVTHEIETRTITEIITENTDVEISNIVVKLSDVDHRYVFRELDFLKKAYALIICTNCVQSLERSAFISTLQVNFETVEDKSNKEILYVRCFNHKREIESPDRGTMGPNDIPSSGVHDDNN